MGGYVVKLDQIPDSIRSMIDNEKFDMDNVGMSRSNILLFPDKVLKIQEISEEAMNEIQAMLWLDGCLPVPKIIAHENRKNKSYLLMTRLPGKMACDEAYMNDPERLTSLLAQAIQELWRIDISACPLNWTLDRKLNAARDNVTDNLVDMDNVEPDTFGPKGFQNPQALLEWLETHRPEEELVLSHGDFCLPNIYIMEDDTFGFLDLGRTGISDKWQDVALCYRSLKYNYSGKYGGKEYPGYDPDMLFEKLGMEPDWEKLTYYTLLDELF